MKKSIWSTIFILFFLVTLAEASIKDVLLLKNGQKIEGKIIEKNEDEIKIHVDSLDMVITYLVNEIETIEKTLPAIVVKDEEQKQELIEKVLEAGVVDAVYDISVEKKEPAPITYEELDPTGEPLPNIGIPFMSPEELLKQNPELKDIGKSVEDLQEEHERAAFPEIFNQMEQE